MILGKIKLTFLNKINFEGELATSLHHFNCMYYLLIEITSTKKHDTDRFQEKFLKTITVVNFFLRLNHFI